MFLAQLATARAASLETTVTWDVPAEPRAVLYLVRTEGPRLVVVGADALRVIDPDTGVAVAEVAHEARAMIARDPDGDGVGELWTCGDAGLWRVGWGADTLDAPVQLGTEACATLVDVGDAVVTVGEAVERRADDGSGGVAAPEDLEFPAFTDPLAAWDGAELAVADRGATVVDVLGRYGVSELAAGGVVAGLGVAGGGLAWTLSDLALLVPAEGDEVPLEAGPETFLEEDVDGDGLVDLVVAHAGAIGVVSGGGTAEVLSATGEGALGLAAADGDGDGCAEVAWLDPATATVTLSAVSDCGAASDADGDGWSPEAGDCDDTNAAVSPAATEACNGVDDDCDDVTDPVASSVAIEGTSLVEEGGAFSLQAAADGCYTTITWDVPELDTFSCSVSGETVACHGYDDERFAVSLTIADADGGVLASASLRIEIENVAPTLSSGGCGSVVSDPATVHPGEHYEEQLRAEDPGDDEITFQGHGLPPGMDVSSDGLVVYDVGQELGTFTPTLVLTDDDGGSSSRTATIVVQEGAAIGCEPTGPGPCCCCGSSSAGAMLGLGALWAARRRRLA